MLCSEYFTSRILVCVFVCVCVFFFILVTFMIALT